MIKAVLVDSCAVEAKVKMQIQISSFVSRFAEGVMRLKEREGLVFFKASNNTERDSYSLP